MVEPSNIYNTKHYMVLRLHRSRTEKPQTITNRDFNKK